MSDEEYFRLAAEALDLGPDGLLMFADLMEERGDVRHWAVRKHAKCCPRAWNMVLMAYEKKRIIQRMEDLEPSDGLHPCVFTQFERFAE